MGTLFRIVLHAPDEAAAKRAFDGAFAIARDLDARLSDYKPDSELNRLCRAGEGTVSAELFGVLRLAREVARKTGGAFDPAAGALIRLWRRGRAAGSLPKEEAIAAARKASGWRHVEFDRRRRRVRLTAPGIQLDLGGIAKGWAADRMLDCLRGAGIDQALVAASGDLAIGAAPPGRRGWRVSLGEGGPVEELRHCAVSTSGPAEQSAVLNGVRYSHIVDPRTGWALRESKPVTVVAARGALADALATALSVEPGLRLDSWRKVRVLR
ncbi:MAG: FAD:protein FMN transferase [Bryobacteraceae bacterium]